MESSFVAIDIETAVGKRWSICQIGLTIIENNKIIQTISEYVQPPGNEYQYWNIKIHKITPELTKDKPFFPEVWDKIYPIIKDRKLVAHNASFDKSCLNQALKHYNIEAPNFDFDCTYKMSGEKLNIACESWGISLKNHHDAACDATACALLYLKLKDNNNNKTPSTQSKKNKTQLKNKLAQNLLEHNNSSSNKFQFTIIEEENKSDKLAGLSIIASGKLQNFSRDDIKKAIEENGGKVVSSVSKKTSYLLTGKNIGPNKLAKAKDLNIPVINEDEFLKMIDS